MGVEAIGLYSLCLCLLLLQFLSKTILLPYSPFPLYWTLSPSRMAEASGHTLPLGNTRRLEEGSTVEVNDQDGKMVCGEELASRGHEERDELRVANGVSASSEGQDVDDDVNITGTRTHNAPKRGRDFESWGIDLEDHPNIYIPVDNARPGFSNIDPKEDVVHYPVETISARLGYKYPRGPCLIDANISKLFNACKSDNLRNTKPLTSTRFP